MQKNGNNNKHLSDHSAIQLELRTKKLTQNCTTSWRLNWLLNVDWINSEMKAKIKMFFEIKRTKAQGTRISGTHLKQSLEGNLYHKNAHMRSEERSKVNTLSSKLKELEEQVQKNSKASRRQEKTKIRVELKEIETEKNPSKTQ